MKYATVCSGIEAPSAAWHDFGWSPVFFSEVDPFPSEVLACHYPDVPNHGDMSKFEDWGYEKGAVDVLVGGTPCQSFSIAGLRAGLEDDRGNLALVFMRMVEQLRPKWVIWENVPGVLSANGGRDFGSILGALDELGYGWAYRVLDAQNFGVPQRRRRVFLVGHSSGDARSAGQVLFERESCGGDTPSSRKTRQETSETAVKCFAGHIESAVAATLQTTCHDWSRADGFNMVQYCADVAPTITSSGPPYSRTGNARVESEALAVQGRVRRLTPIECERLQGFPDNYTDIPYRNKPNAPDSGRYKALGNSMAVPVMRWIGERIRRVENA